MLSIFFEGKILFIGIGICIFKVEVKELLGFKN